LNDADAELVGRAQAGDRAAFEGLVRRTGRLVFARLYLDTGDPHKAEDLVQETFLLAYRSIGQLKEPGGFRPWLLAIANRAMLDAARRDGRKKRSGPTAPDVVLALVPANGIAPDAAAQAEEGRAKVIEALRGLPEEYRLPLSLRYLAGADYEAISQQLGLTNGSLRGMLHRGLKLLKERMPAEV
jgi:RNA polymerase sigma-70 factor (ECF subfamily)